MLARHSGRRLQKVHRKIEITTEPAVTDELLSRLQQIDDVIAVAVDRGSSVNPPGDMVAIASLNRAADDVFRCVQAPGERSRVIVASDATSISDPSQQDRIENDVSEEL